MKLILSFVLVLAMSCQAYACGSGGCGSGGRGFFRGGSCGSGGCSSCASSARQSAATASGHWVWVATPAKAQVAVKTAPAAKWSYAKNVGWSHPSIGTWGDLTVDVPVNRLVSK